MPAEFLQFSQVGFSCKNYVRNKVLLVDKSIGLPIARKTGTTIAGCIFKDGAVLGADSRATEDVFIADKECQKIHYLADNIYCSGAGVSADCDAVTQLISSQLALHQLNTERIPRVVCALRMTKQLLFRHEGQLATSLLIGGVDITGPHIACIYPHGSSAVLPFASMGSGSFAAMSMLETHYQADMKQSEAEELVRDSILAGIANDLGSGSDIDICTVTKDFVNYQRPYHKAYNKTDYIEEYKYEPGITKLLRQRQQKLDLQVMDLETFPLRREEDDDE